MTEEFSCQCLPRYFLLVPDYSGIDSITKWIRQFNSEADIREQHVVKQK